MKLATTLKQENGEADVVAWIIRLLYENDDVFYFEDKPGVTYIKIDTIKPFYELLSIKIMSGLTV